MEDTPSVPICYYNPAMGGRETTKGANLGIHSCLRRRMGENRDSRVGVIVEVKLG